MQRGLSYFNPEGFHVYVYFSAKLNDMRFRYKVKTHLLSKFEKNKVAYTMREGL